MNQPKVSKSSIFAILAGLRFREGIDSKLN
jgi:hypothetical protein